jgi:hypothetical protein
VTLIELVTTGNFPCLSLESSTVLAMFVISETRVVSRAKSWIQKNEMYPMVHRIDTMVTTTINSTSVKAFLLLLGIFLNIGVRLQLKKIIFISLYETRSIILCDSIAIKRVFQIIFIFIAKQ